MGMTFANLHLRKSSTCSAETLRVYLCDEMQAKQYRLTDDLDSADVTAVIYAPQHSEWVTVSLDSWQQSAVDWQRIAARYADTFGTDVLAAACFDSDYLLLHLRNTADGTDGWVNVGRPEGGKLPRRTSLTPFRGKVSDFDAFKAAVKAEHVSAESALVAAAETLHMDSGQCTLDAQYPDVSDKSVMTVLYFTAPASERKMPAALRFSGTIPSHRSIGKEMLLTFYNMLGGKSKGIAVMFDAVGDDALTFTDVVLAIQNKPYAWNDMRRIPVTLERRTLETGKTVYYWEDKNFVIPAYDRKRCYWMSLRFTPQGNPRKVLDIRVTVTPLGVEQGYTDTWYFWKGYGSKREYIETNNKMCAEIGRMEDLLNPNDFDLD